MRKDSLEVINSVQSFGLDVGNRTIFLHSEGDTSGEEDGVDYKMAVNFQKNLYILNYINHNPITINMLCIGGDVDYGMGIFDLIKNSPSEITIVANAYCCSMGTIILQAAHKRILMPSVEFMIHYGKITSQNNDLGLVKNNYEYWTRKNNIMLKIYAERCAGSQFYKEHKMNEAKMIKFLDKTLKENQDWYLTAEQAVYYGFADEVYNARN